MYLQTHRQAWLLFLVAATVAGSTTQPQRQLTNSRRLEYVDASVSRRTSTTTLPAPTTTPPSSDEDKTLGLAETTGVTRTIHRTMGGHLHHPVYRNHQEEASTVAPRGNTRLPKVYFQRKPNRDWDSKTRTSTPPPFTTTTDKVFIVTPINNVVNKTNHRDDESNDDDDAELLTDDNRLLAWANDRLLAASAGAGPELTAKPKDESKKTLSDQVAEGKYGLIQKELFLVPPKRPGIISYAANPEVPNDTADNLGGLNDEDIWLAEDHLLVIKGGHLNTPGNQSPDAWRPIDNYQAPRRPVKLPDNPKVPPPFLVQLDENGPLKFIGNHQFPLINPFTNHSLLLFPDGGGFPQADTHDSDQKNIFARPRPADAAAADMGYKYPSPVPAWMSEGDAKNQSAFPPFLMPPVMHLPVLPPKGSLDDQNNVTDDYDEDDPSLYYPPPYSFTYESNYTNPVAPGPLVPGIILPPPPNFFTRLNPQKSSSTSTTTSTARPQAKPIKTRTSSTTPKTSTTSTTTPSTTSAKPINRIILKPRTTLPPPRTTPAQLRTIVRPVYQTTTPRTTTQLRKVVQPAAGRPHSEIISFVSKDEQRPIKASPVYFEYYDARNEPKTTSKYSSTTTTTSTSTTTVVPPLKLKPAGPVQRVQSAPITSKVPVADNTHLRPQRPTPKPRPYNAYLPVQPFDYERYVYITPKPEITPNGISNHVTTSEDDSTDTFVPLRKVPSRPVEVFRQEVDSIRQTLEYYKDKQRLQHQYQPSSSPAPSFYDPQPQRSPKAKAVYEYSFEAATAASPLLNDPNIFLPPSKYDTTPFKPMVQYSAPLDETDGFKAISYSTTTEPSAQKPLANRVQAARNYVHKEQPMNYYPNAGRQHQQPIYDYDRYQQQPQFVSAISTTTVEPWISIEKQFFRQVQNSFPKEINVQIQPDDQYDPYYGRQRNYYNYQQQQPYFRQINRLQQQQHQQFLLQQAQQLHHQHQFQKQQQQQVQQQQQQQQQPQPEYNLSNDTAVNYLHPRPSVNPDAEYIDPAQLHPPRQYAQQQHSQQQQSQPQPHPFPPPPLPQRPGSGNRYYPVPIHQPTLAKDMLVNYKLPLPHFNPNAEYVPEDEDDYRRYLGQAQRPAASANSVTPTSRPPKDAPHPDGAHSDVVRYKLPGDQEANVYFYTPTQRQAVRNR